MCARVRPLGQELARAERPRNAIPCRTHGWQSFMNAEANRAPPRKAGIANNAPDFGRPILEIALQVAIDSSWVSLPSRGGWGPRFGGLLA